MFVLPAFESVRRFRTVFLCALLGVCASVRAGTVRPFLTPPKPVGSLTVALHPMENVEPGTSRLVTFGVPFPRGSLTPAGLSTVRVLRDGAEIPAHVAMLTPWRHLTNAAVDAQSVRVARVQIRHTFSVAYPDSEMVTVEWGGAARTLDVLTLTDPLTGWHPVTNGTFLPEDNIREPDVYAMLPKEVLAEGALDLRRSTPFTNTIPEVREDPAEIQEIARWPGYEESDRSFKNFFYTVINEDDPLVTQYGNKMLTDYRHDAEPWLYDRAATFFQLYIKSGFLRPLREAVRATQFYRSKLYGASAPAPYQGVFRLKAPDLSQASGGNTTMYSYAECLAYDHWITGDPSMPEAIRWVAATHNSLTEPTRWAPTLGEWTERHTAFSTLANLVAFEVTGEASYRQNVLRHIGDYLWHQDGAGGQLPTNRVDGGLYHYGRQHGDGVPTELIASPWMMTLLTDAMARAYALYESPAVAQFLVRAGRFQSVATHYNEDSIYEFPGALRYPIYVVRADGLPDEKDGYEGAAIDHSKEVLTSIAWGSYFHHFLYGGPDPDMEAVARELYFSVDVGATYYTRPPAPLSGLTAFRVAPPRQWNWENRPSTSMSWVMGLIDEISPPPVVAIVTPVANQRFTAPADIFIEATAFSAVTNIVKVEFFDGSTKIGEDTTAPYTLQWNGIIASLPAHVLTARAITALGVKGSSDPVTLDVRSPTQPSLTITSPAPGEILTAPADAIIAATAVPQAGSTITRVLVTQSYRFVAEDTTAPYEIPLAGLLDGDHEYEVWAWDNNGGYTVQMFTIQVRTPTPPSVVLTRPETGDVTVNGAVLRFRAEASAPGSQITRVVFYADDTPVGEDEEPPYEFDWKVSPRWAAGIHRVAAEAYETLGGVAVSTNAVEVIALDPMTAEFISPDQDSVFPFPSTISMEATGTAPGSAIDHVEFFANGRPVGTDSEPPYTTTFVPDVVRQWELLARVVDTFGRSADVQRRVHVTGPARPVVTVTSPTNGAILISPAITTLTAEATVIASTITSMKFYDGSVLLGEDTEAPFSITTPPLDIGDHSIYAVATAATGTTGQSPVNIVTVGAPDSPVVVITAPRYSGPQFAPSFDTVRLAASARHTGAGRIARVEFRFGNELIAVDTEAPYEVDWVVGNRTGYHEMVARAVDENGVFVNSTMVAFDLIIPPLISITSPVEGAILQPGQPVMITAQVTRGTYSLDRVVFRAGTQAVWTVTSAPFAVQWTPTQSGPVKLMARVSDTRFVDVDAPDINVMVAENAAPVAVSDTLERPLNSAMIKVPVATLLANDTDGDGDALSITNVGGALPAGATVTLRAGWVIYTVPAGSTADGSFEYVMTDGPGGHTAIGTVFVPAVAPRIPGSAPNAARVISDGPDVIVSFIGIPGRTYRVQYATNTIPPLEWREFMPAAIYSIPTDAQVGVLNHSDINPPEPVRIYRAIPHP